MNEVFQWVAVSAGVVAVVGGLVKFFKWFWPIWWEKNHPNNGSWAVAIPHNMTERERLEFKENLREESRIQKKRVWSYRRKKLLQMGVGLLPIVILLLIVLSGCT